MNAFLTELPCAALGALGFALIFGLRENKLIYAALGGGLTWLIYLLCESFISSNIVICSFIAAVAGTAYSEILARILRTPATVILLPAVIPLVPGGSLYYAMSALISSDRTSAASYGADTVRFAVGIAAGITVVTIFFRMLNREKR